MKLSEDLRKLRAERPDEWTMDRLINHAEQIESVIQLCFDDACKPNGKISKTTALELMKHANTAA